MYENRFQHVSPLISAILLIQTSILLDELSAICRFLSRTSTKLASISPFCTQVRNKNLIEKNKRKIISEIQSTVLNSWVIQQIVTVSRFRGGNGLEAEQSGLCPQAQKDRDHSREI